MGFWKSLFQPPQGDKSSQQGDKPTPADQSQRPVAPISKPQQNFKPTSSNGLLTENDVIRAVSSYLEVQGYRVTSSSNTSQQGVDIVARYGQDDRHEVYIEAKGATSSKEGTARSGMAFTDSQQLDHVSKAIYASMKAMSTALEKGISNRQVGIALPITEYHKRHIGRVSPALSRLGIRVYWVRENGEVVVQK